MTTQTQNWNPEQYMENAPFVAALGKPVVSLLNPVPGERILDLGCGEGTLMEELEAVGCQVVGVDSSAPQVEATKARGLTATVMDASQLTFDTEFDAVFSNAVLHWVQQPDMVIDGVWRALKPGGRFVGEFGGHSNIAKIKAAVYKALEQRGIDPQPLDPWYFPTPEDYRQRLENRGFEVGHIALIPRPTPLPTNIAGWLDTFAESFTSVLPAEERAAFIAEVEDTLRPQPCDENGQWTADYVRLRFAARKTD